MAIEEWIHPNLIALTLLLPAVVCGALALYSFMGRQVTGSRVFSFLMLAAFIWSMAYGLELCCLRLEPMLFFVGLEYIGIVSIPPLWLILTLIHTGRGERVTPRATAFLFIIPVITLLLNVTNQYHNLYYSRVGVDYSGPIPLLAIGIGPWYIVFMAYYYICLLLGTILLLLRLRDPARLYRRQVAAMLTGIMVPWIVNVLYFVFDIKPFGHLDLTPFAFTFTGIAMAWGIFHQRLFDVVPVAHDLVIENMAEGMVILDNQNRIVESNAAATRIFGWKMPPVGMDINTAWQGWPEMIGWISSGLNGRTELNFERAGQNQHYEALLSDLKDRRGLKLGRTILIHDVSTRRRAQQDLSQQEEKFLRLFQTSRDAIYVTSVDGRWLEANDAAATLFGYAGVEELKAVPVTEIYTDPETRREYSALVASQGYADSFPATFRKRDGSLISALVSGVAVRDKAGNITAYQGTIKDVTQLMQYEKDLLLTQERLMNMLSETEQRNREITLLGEMAQRIQASRDIETAYAGAARYLGEMFSGDSGALAVVNNQDGSVKAKAVFGTPQGLMDFPASDCLTLKLGKTYEYDGSGRQEICKHLGEYQGYYMSIPLIAPGDNSWLLSLQSGEDGKAVKLTGSEWLDLRRPLLGSAAQELMLALSNIKLRDILREQATRDPLTGLYNRRYMDEMLARELSGSIRSGKGVGFIMGDLDYFKKFNDTYGHEAGDLLLKAVANLIRGTIRVEDIACRYGGEEFLIILPSASLQDAYRRAVQIHDSVEKISFGLHGATIDGVTISMGVSAFPNQGKTADELIAAADAAMYRAKREGRNRVCLP
jgi:diguanylate cyclase (GGDEF)-like protein/PAS domain S-box-containing protein